MNDSQGSFFEEDEIRTAEILLQLHSLFSQSDHGHTFRFAWGCKRRRSAMASPPSTSRLHLAKAEASSPATPLSFSPSESDEKSKRSKGKRQKHKKLQNEELLETIKQLNQQKSDLQKEVEKVKRYYDTLKAFNSELKAKQLELSQKREKEIPNSETTKQSLNLNLALVHSTVSNDVAAVTAAANHDRQVQQTLIGDQTVVQSYPYPCVALYPPPQMEVARGPPGIPDLNLTAEDPFGFEAAQPFDMEMANRHITKAMAAQARQNRLQIKRLKNSAAYNNNSKARFAYR